MIRFYCHFTGVVLSYISVMGDIPGKVAGNRVHGPSMVTSY